MSRTHLLGVATLVPKVARLEHGMTVGGGAGRTILSMVASSPDNLVPQYLYLKTLRMIGVTF